MSPEELPPQFAIVNEVILCFHPLVTVCRPQRALDGHPCFARQLDRLQAEFVFAAQTVAPHWDQHHDTVHSLLGQEVLLAEQRVKVLRKKYSPPSLNKEGDNVLSTGPNATCWI